MEFEKLLSSEILETSTTANQRIVPATDLYTKVADRYRKDATDSIVVEA